MFCFFLTHGVDRKGLLLAGVCLMHYYPAPDRRTGYSNRAICLFIYLFLCQQHYEKKAGPICMKFSGKVWSDHGTT